MVVHFLGWLGILFLNSGFTNFTRLNGGLGLVQSALVEALALGGAWIISTPDPGGLGEEQYGFWRKAVRAVAVIKAIDWLAQRFAVAMAFSARTPSNVIPLDLLFTVGYGISAALLAAQLGYLRRLAARLPNIPLAALARFLFWTMTVSAFAPAVFRLILVHARAFTWFPALRMTIGLIRIAYTILTVLYLRLIVRWRRELKQEIEFARIRWANPQQPFPPVA
jgi:hypothetical protein